MSLINEALRRTRDQSFEAGASRPMSVADYRLADRAHGPRNMERVTLVVLGIVAVFAVALIVYILRPTREIAVALSTPAPPPVVAPVAVATPPVVAPDKVEPAPAPPPQQPPPPPPEPPKLVLQGIMSEAGSREALINGYSLREGEDIEGARITAIESRLVRLQFHDKEIVLRMP